MGRPNDADDLDAFRAALAGHVLTTGAPTGDPSAVASFAALMARLWELSFDDPRPGATAPPLARGDLAPATFRADRGWPPA